MLRLISSILALGFAVACANKLSLRSNPSGGGAQQAQTQTQVQTPTQNNQTTRRITSCSPEQTKGLTHADYITALKRLPSFHSYGNTKEMLKEMRDTGIAVFRVETNMFGSDNGFSPSIATGPNSFDFTDLDKKLADIVAANRDACILIQSEFGLPRGNPTADGLPIQKWWLDSYSSELETDESGNTVKKSLLGEPTQFASLSSRIYQTQVLNGLSKLLEHLAASPYAQQIIGFKITGLFTQELYSYDSGFSTFRDRPAFMYSNPTRLAFREFLINKYKTDDQLSRAWKQTVTLAGANIPPYAKFVEHLSRPASMFYESRMIPDVLEFRSAQIVQMLEKIGERIKSDATFKERVVVALYGYLNEFSNPSYGVQGFSRLAHSPYLDGVLHMDSYRERNRIIGTTMERGPIDILSMLGKVASIDWDQGTFLSKSIIEQACEYNRIHSPDLYYGASQCSKPDIIKMWLDSRSTLYQNNGNDTADVYKRFIGHAVSRDAAFGLMSLWTFNGKNDFSDPTLLAHMKKIHTAVSSLNNNQLSSAKILVVTDEESVSSVRIRSDGGAANAVSLFIGEPLKSFSRMGTPYHHIPLRSLSKIDLTPYKMVVFLNAFFIDDDTEKFIRANLLNNNRLILWAGPVGRASGNSSISDIQLNYDAFESTFYTPSVVSSDVPSPLQARLKADVGPFSINQATDGICCGLVYAADPRASILGTYFGTGTTSFAVRQLSNYTSVWSATAALSPAIYRSIARYANVHIYSDTDEQVSVSRELLTLHAQNAGEKIIRFPQPVRAFDFLTGKELQLDSSGTQLKTNLNAGDTLMVKYQNK